MKHIFKYLGLIMMLILFGCNQNSERANMKMAAQEAVASKMKRKTSEIVERKLIKKGHIAFETDNLNATRKTIFKAVDKHKGYISSDQTYKSPGRKSNTITIRVPADNFDKLLSDATKDVEKFERKEINVQDVTEEFLDIQARLKTKKELEQRYIELLKQAKNVTEILKIEEQIGKLRSDIESIEGRLRYLQDTVSFSMLSMTFYENIPHETAFGQKFKNGFRNGWDNLVWFLVGLTNVWPFLLMGLGLIIGIRFYRRKKSKKARL